MIAENSYDLHGSTGYQLSLLSRLNERKFEQRLAPLGLSRTMWCVLLALREENLSTPSDIAEFIGIDRTAASRTLRHMEAKGFITRKSGIGDGRSKRVIITYGGERALDAAIPLARDNARIYAEKLSAREYREFQRLIGKLIEGEARGVSNL